jgi:hypothetical protein
MLIVVMLSVNRAIFITVSVVESVSASPLASF